MKLTYPQSSAGEQRIWHGCLGGLLAFVLIIPEPAFASASFSDAAAGLPGLASAIGAWGDYDNDGDLDLILVGFENSVGDRLILWRNDHGIFTRQTADLPETASGMPAWGDYDNDGDLDLALLVDGPEPSQYATEIWRNAGVFTREFSIPIGAFRGNKAWVDFDADGDLDLIFQGPNVPPCPLHILRNDRGSFFHQPAGIEADVFAVADYDNDGDADVVGRSGSLVRLWRNDSGTFAGTNLSFSGIGIFAFSWADFDHDSDLDLLICGRSDTGLPPPNGLRVFRNDGGAFTEGSWASPAFAAGGLAWGDFDNDGRMDLAGLTINAETVIAYSSVLRNTGAALIESGLQFPFQFSSTDAWGDYDNDGDLDLVLSGGHRNGHLITQVLRNDHPTANNSPSAPDGLTALVSGASVTLSWRPAADAETSSGALTYNLRMGRTPGAFDVMTPQSDLSSGRRRLPHFGNAPSGTTARLVLPAATYYWSVQAVDSAFAGGPFSSESTFTVLAPAPNVKTGAASSIMATQATLHGAVDPRGLTTSVSFEWGTTTAYGESTPKVNLTGSSWNLANQELTGLQVGVLYHYRIVASSAGGTVFGSDRSFTTRPFMPGPTVVSGVVVGSQAWGDYDLDGHLDVVIGAFDPATSSSSAQLWRNNSGGFVRSNAELPRVDGTVAWGDYDRDGDLDLLLSGWADSPDQPGYVTQIWRNIEGDFADIGAGLPGSDGSAAWGDFDNDGDLDLVITGNALTTQSVQIWRNDGGIFVQVPTNFPVLSDPQAFWGDSDTDGDIDLLIMGGSQVGSVTRLYRNDGGVLSDTDQPLRGFQAGDASWGDFDSDGDLDLAIGGLSNRDDGASERTLEIWRNDRGIFIVAAVQLASLHDLRLAWGDWDNDGDLDLAAGGIAAGGSENSKLFRNDHGALVEMNTGLMGYGPVSWVDYDRDGDLDLLSSGQIWRNEGQTFNSPPSSPANLSASLVQEHLVFTWSQAADAQTPSAALTYNLRVGSQPRQNDVVAAPADPVTGFLRGSRFGTIQNTQAFLSGFKLSVGTYYWSVQAIDGANAGGAFAPESSFTFSAGAPLVNSGMATASASSAHVQGSVHPRGLLTTAWLEWGKTPAYGQVLSLPNLSGPTGLDVNPAIPELEVETVYHYRLVARNAAGTTYGADQTFKTRRFTLIGGTPALVNVTSAAWSDFDGDGDPDLVICGSNAQGPVTQIWWNDQWIFRPALRQLTGAPSGSIDSGDFDCDGDLDLLICGESQSQVWRNQAGDFSLAASLPGVAAGSAAWGDYDNDGDLDLLLSGWDGSGDCTKIWRNDSGALVPSGIELPQRAWPHATWTDYDKDGDLDLLLIGAQLDPSSTWLTSVTELWRNGNGQFIPATIDLPALGVGSAQWADYDSEGNLDVLLCFHRAAAQIRQNRGGSFIDIRAPLPAVANNSTSWGDYDGDGDLDLALAGLTPIGPVQQIWRNDQGTFVNIDAGLTNGTCVAWADFDQDGDLDLLVGGQVWRNDGTHINAEPPAPLALNDSVAGNRVVFNWTAPHDDRTPVAGLAYNLHLERASVTSNAPFSLIDLKQSTRTFLDLPNGIFYWSVQTVDSAGVRSPWAPEHLVIISADSDSDALPDVWETDHGFDPNSSADGDADPDGDGITNTEEFAANTDPRDPNSLLTIVAVEPDELDLRVSFSTARGKSYHLENSPVSPNGPWTRIFEDIPGGGGVVSVQIPSGNAQAKAFYRVVAQP